MEGLAVGVGLAVVGLVGGAEVVAWVDVVDWVGFASPLAPVHAPRATAIDAAVRAAVAVRVQVICFSSISIESRCGGPRRSAVPT